MLNRHFILLCVVGLSAHSSVFALELVLRRDLQKNLNATLCQNTSSLALTDYWQKSVYDVHVSGIEIRIKRGGISPKYLDKTARAMAARNKHYGYAYGQCSSTKAWVASVPSPVVLGGLRSELGTAKLSADPKAYCHDGLRLEVARSADSSTKTLAPALGKDLLFQGAGDGTLAVHCLRRDGIKQVAILWFFAPVGKGPDTNLPFASELYKTRDPAANLAKWINLQRRQWGYSQLGENRILQQEARQQVKTFGTDHNHSALATSAKKLKASGIELLGEDRVIGPTTYAMAWMLWNSPTHRRLLLDARATLTGVVVAAQDNERLASVLMARPSAKSLSLKALP